MTVMMTGRSNGKMTRKNRPRLEQPSIIAASSSWRGIVATKARNRMMLNGARKATSTSTIPQSVSNRCASCST